MNNFKRDMFLIICLILTFCLRSEALGVTYFSDDFANNLDNWTFVPGTMDNVNSWKIADGTLVGTAVYNGSSYLYPKLVNSVLTDFVLETDLMSVNGVDANIIFRESVNKNEYYVVGFRSSESEWPQDNNNIVLYKYVYGYSLVDTYPSGKIGRSFNLSQNIWHKIKIDVSGQRIKIFYDGQLAIDYLDSGTVLGAGKIGLQNWGGSFSNTVINKIDNFRVTNGVTQNKIVFLPGMGGSWNERAMVLNQNVSQSEWRMTPFVKNYDSILNAFDTNNLIKNKDYYVYNYDWRKPMASQIIDFNNYVSGLGITGSEKVDIVGHSMGGLIGRIWTQENTNKVGKVITLGTPNLGSVKVYEMWNGAKISDSVDISSIAINVLLALQHKNKQTAVETLQTYAPALKDLLPTFNYLKKNGANVTPPSNSYLTDKNLGVSSIFDKLLAVSGSGFKTKDTINLTERTVFDTMLGLWPQGRPLSFVEADGDVTVLKKSAVVAGDNSANVVSNHGEITNKSVNIVLSELGLGKTISYVAGNSFDGAVFYIGSPASLKVNCGADDINETDGFVLVAGKNMADCIVKLTGTENGTYHLVMGNSSDDTSFKYSEGNISIGDTKNISVKMVDFWYEQMIREINTLLNVYPTNTNLKNMKTAAVSKNRTNLISSYVLFRKQKIETIITWRMVDYLEKIINIEIPSTTTVVMNKQKNLALSAKALTDKTASLLQRQKRYPNTWQSLNYKQGEELLISPNYGKYLLAEKVFAMVWY